VYTYVQALLVYIYGSWVNECVYTRRYITHIPACLAYCHLWFSVLQCVAVCCSVLQCVAVCCSV